ncbi:tropomyosin-like [Prorops nasuta]|uniref:tropomyosin-like n=1 Tax=Prorops nasuta TaxID=863751 RepID=UPI0034CD55D1
MSENGVVNGEIYVDGKQNNTEITNTEKSDVNNSTPEQEKPANIAQEISENSNVNNSSIPEQENIVELVPEVSESSNEINNSILQQEEILVETVEVAPAENVDTNNAKAEQQRPAETAQNSTQTKNEEASIIEKLEKELKKRTEERDEYKKKLCEADKKLASLQTPAMESVKNVEKNSGFLKTMDQLKTKLAGAYSQLEDRNRVVANQENQINALNNQVVSLKEVVDITRDLLQIRNMEVKHLQQEVNLMEKKIIEERERHNSIVNKMDAASRLNADLKKEYEIQLHLFNDLRGKYEEKVTLLSEEKKALESAVQKKAMEEENP